MAKSVLTDEQVKSAKLNRHASLRWLPAFVRRYRPYGLPLLYGASALFHWRQLSALIHARRGSTLERLVAARPEIWSFLRVRFVAAHWTARDRFRRIIDHCDLMESIGRPFDIKPNEAATLMTMDRIGPSFLLVLDSARWLFREGLLVLSLMDRQERIFAIVFTLARERNGDRTAYVGGIQGGSGKDALLRNRAFTKAAGGTRPQDMLVEMFRALCQSANVSRILCVSDRIRNGQTAFAHSDAGYADPVMFDYDALWRERGGTLRSDGFFDVPLVAPVRDDSDIPAKRRQARRKKLALIDALKQDLGNRLSDPATIQIDKVEPV
ncbi:uncharacterized protein VirK/YbjX [Rhizobium sp. PP-F2F-G48]|uniref:DUF535 family protein n=1 Tax=Rhizobium sp. PP-F2F-G48 TaxID=2135651 RepID=UPI0010CE2DC7|nr:DUF535 family protein [Rhizobium sp. PP-F2F-G48]TCM53058.1 uncharacterized protein VirK/YbjX [Rhizobium sp. PP-F2F-G48]